MLQLETKPPLAGKRSLASMAGKAGRQASEQPSKSDANAFVKALQTGGGRALRAAQAAAHGWKKALAQSNGVMQCMRPPLACRAACSQRRLTLRSHGRFGRPDEAGEGHRRQWTFGQQPVKQAGRAAGARAPLWACACRKTELQRWPAKNGGWEAWRGARGQDRLWAPAALLCGGQQCPTGERRMGCIAGNAAGNAGQRVRRVGARSLSANNFMQGSRPS